MHRALGAGHTEVTDGDVSSYFDTIPHADLMKSLACCPTPKVFPMSRAIQGTRIRNT